MAGVIMLTGIVIWRLSTGPVSLGFLTPTIQDALQRSDLPLEVEIGDTILTWGGWERAIDIELTNVALRREGEAPAAVLPRITIGLSIEALGRGRFAPTSLSLIEPEVLVRRYADGSFAMGVASRYTGNPAAGSLDVEDPDAAGEEPELLPLSVLQVLLQPPPPDSPLAYLEEVKILNATASLVDRVAGLTWRFPRADIVLVRDGNETRGNVSAVMSADGSDTRLSAVMLRTLDDNAFSFSMSFDEFQPSLIARAFPRAAFLGRVDVPLSGSIGFRIALDGTPLDATIGLSGAFGRASLDLGFAGDGSALAADLRLIDVNTRALADIDPRLSPLAAVNTGLNGLVTIGATPAGDVQTLQFDVTAGPGTADLSDAGIGAEAFRGATVSGIANVQARSADIAAFTVDLLDDTFLAGRASAAPEGDGHRVIVEAEVNALPFGELGQFWPEGLGEAARDWVLTNMPEGEVPSATLSFDGLVDAETGDVLAIDRFGGTIVLDDAAVHYFRPMAPVTGVNAVAEYDLDGFRITTRGGRIGPDILLESGAILITDIGRDDAIDISVQLNSDLAAALTLLDSEPLGLVSDLGLSPGALSGRGAANVSFAFPLLSDLDIEQVRYGATAKLSGVTLGDTPLGVPLEDGLFDLKLEQEGMSVSGDAVFLDQPVSLVWRELFGAEADPRTTYALRGTFDDRHLAVMGLDPGDYLTGPVGIDITYRSVREGGALIDLVADTRQARMAIDLLKWEKPAGPPGQVSARIGVDALGFIDMRNIRVVTETLQASGSGRFQPQFADIVQARVDELAFGQTRASGTISRDTEGSLAITLTGPQFDVAPFLAESDDGADASAETDETGDGLPDFDVIAQFDQVLNGPGRTVEGARLEIAHEDGRYQRILFDGSVSDGPVSFRLGPDEAEGGRSPAQTLAIRAEDGGATLAALDWTDRLRGGRFVLDARRDGPDAPFAGALTMEDFQLVEAPGLAKVLEFMSLTGIVSALGSSGLTFIEAETGFQYADGILTFQDGRAYGASIGITGSGLVDVNADRITVEGTVVPAYTFNRIIGAIPLIGPLVTGGEGEGVFAANYKIDGPLDDPEAAINPLSALAPSFLRRLFKADPNAEPVTSPEGND